MATFGCGDKLYVLWVAYGLFKKPRDLPVAIANAPGIVLGLFAFITSF